MPPSKVVIFGSPKVGTNLMLENPGIATELPLRIAVWEDKEGSTWISFPHMEKLPGHTAWKICLLLPPSASC